MRDESYFRITAAHAWHILELDESDLDDGSFVSYCGRVAQDITIEDRIPNEGWMCRGCGRIQSSRVDVEPRR